jgi:hypothetical protein
MTRGPTAPVCPLTWEGWRLRFQKDSQFKRLVFHRSGKPLRTKGCCKASKNPTNFDNAGCEAISHCFLLLQFLPIRSLYCCEMLWALVSCREILELPTPSHSCRTPCKDCAGRWILVIEARSTQDNADHDWSRAMKATVSVKWIQRIDKKSQRGRMLKNSERNPKDCERIIYKL